MRDVDRGRPFEEQCVIQNYMYAKEHGLKLGLKDLKELKTRYWKMYKDAAFHEFHFYAVIFADVLPVVACGAISPEYDFVGNNLQSLLRLDSPIEQSAFNLTSVDGESIAIFGWLDNAGRPSSSRPRLGGYQRQQRQTQRYRLRLRI